MIQESVQRLLHHVNNDDSRTKPFSPFIYMVPGRLRNVNPDSFNPQLVSIGPLHRRDTNVQEFEGKKGSYLINLLRRIEQSPTEILESCMEKVYALMSDIKASYIWTEPFTDAEIAEMMVMDACFILEFMMDAYTMFAKELYSGKLLQCFTIMRDLLLLENQIPLFCLHAVFQCTILKLSHDETLFILLFNPILFVHNLFEGEQKTENVSMSAKHILGLLHQCYTPPGDIIKDEIRTRINSVVDLDLAGVIFNPSKDLTWAMGMEVKQLKSFFGFWSKPTLTMPVLRVQDFTEFLLRNLIAYEQSFPTENYVTAYAFTLDMLVNTQDDVAKLVESGVLENILGSNEEAANMINNICKNTSQHDFYYKKEFEKLDKYCNGYWPKHISSMRRTYYNNPWKIIALVAGSILFALQVLQAIFTVKSGLK